MRCCCCSGVVFGSTAPVAVARHSSDLLFASTKSNTSVPSFFSMAWLFPLPTVTRPALPTGMPASTAGAGVRALAGELHADQEIRIGVGEDGSFRLKLAIQRRPDSLDQQFVAHRIAARG